MYKFKRAFIVGFASVILFMVSGCGGAKIELSFEKESYEVTVGKELELMPTVKNADEKDYALKFSSEDEDIATYVDGVVKGVGVGQVTVRVELEDNEKIFAEAIIKVVEAKKFTVTFDTAGGSEIDPVEVVEGEKLTRPSDPTKAGHEFAGWFKDAATTEAFDFDTPITAAITLYAKWAIKVYTVAFETNGGSAIDPVSVNHGAKVEEPETPIREGFEFTGWFIDEDLTDPFD
ncbi:MAG: InlB B-repeat-containing protein, partial [Bacilli bacterium]